jgi:hypothetical protein
LNDFEGETRGTGVSVAIGAREPDFNALILVVRFGSSIEIQKSRLSSCRSLLTLSILAIQRWQMAEKIFDVQV